MGKITFRRRGVICASIFLAVNAVACVAAEPMDAIWSAWKDRQSRLRTVRFAWIEKCSLTTANAAALETTTNWDAAFGEDIFKVSLDIHYRRPADEHRKITVLSCPEFEMTCWQLRNPSEATVLPGGSGCWNLETSYRFLQPLFRPTAECTPQDFTVSKTTFRVDDEQCIPVTRKQFYMRNLWIVTTLYISPAFDFVPLRRVVEMRDDQQEPLRTVDTKYNFETVHGEVMPRSWYTTTTFRGQQKIEKTLAAVKQMDLNREFDTSTFQFELMPGTRLTDCRERDGFPPQTLTNKMLFTATPMLATQAKLEPLPCGD